MQSSQLIAATAAGGILLYNVAGPKIKSWLQGRKTAANPDCLGLLQQAGRIIVDTPFADEQTEKDLRAKFHQVADQWFSHARRRSSVTSSVTAQLESLATQMQKGVGG